MTSCTCTCCPQTQVSFIFVFVPSQESEQACVLGVSNFASFFDFDIWSCSDSMVFFVLHLILDKHLHCTTLCRMPMINCITQCCIEYIPPWAEFELTTFLGVICTDYTCSGKSNYHATTTTVQTFSYCIKLIRLVEITGPRNCRLGTALFSF
jgi:hypothetical protein